MKSQKIVLVDYGAGNLKSVSNALKYLGADAIISQNPETIDSAEKIILPGVGNFSTIAYNLRELELDSVLREKIFSGTPFLGICLGMQVLFDESEEFIKEKGLGVFKGRSIRFKGKIKIPQIGWNQLKIINKKSPLFKGIKNNSFAYFVHSYYVYPHDKSITAATTNYGLEYCSAISKDNVFATQFHLEKSGETGLKMLKNFSEIKK